MQALLASFSSFPGEKIVSERAYCTDVDVRWTAIYLCATPSLPVGKFVRAQTSCDQCASAKVKIAEVESHMICQEIQVLERGRSVSGSD